MADYLRQMPHQGSADLARRPSAISRLHLDIPLLLLLLVLTAYGLIVLYSGSGKDMGAVIRQGRFFLIAYVVMFFIAQLSLIRIMRWA
jgi:rod shape determining protein RodA